jgi:7,8-dihydropterin-6-yl-methyl-4-(beta-D-ribofuranosyl)aminobenzene 5'-phosphate synthase
VPEEVSKVMPVSATVLVDDQATKGLSAEHGLSLWIDAGTERILFDTGQGGVLEKNAQELRIELDQASILILSHGHSDHTGGLACVLNRNQKISVYCHPDITKVRYSVRDGTLRQIQMPQSSLAALKALPAERIHWLSETRLITTRIGVTGPIPRETNYEDTGGQFYLDLEGKCVDQIEDDLALWIQSEKGLVLCVGCCHAGIVNTLNHVRRLSGQQAIYAIIGGFHLLKANDRRLKLTIEALRSFSPSFIVPCHCSGEKAIQTLKGAFQERVIRGRAGQTFEL